MGCVERDREMKRRRKRREKLKVIRKAHAASNSEGEKADLLAKARKISPLFTFDE